MSANITKLILLTLILTVVLYLAGLQLFAVSGLENTAGKRILAIGLGAGALIASLFTGIFLLVRPYRLPIRKKTLFIGNLAFKASDRELRNLLGEYGEVFSIRLMTDKVTRKPRGYGFVEMEIGAADKALEALNGAEFMGRELRVSLANEPSQQKKREQ